MSIGEAARKARIEALEKKKQKKENQKQRMIGNKYASNQYWSMKKKPVTHDPYDITSDMQHNNFNSKS